jgi:hypothetical protein
MQQSGIVGAVVPKKKIESESRPHTTDTEIKFISGLGSWRRTPGNNAVLVKKYLKAAERRVRWGGIDKDQVLKFARGLV